MVRAGRLPLVGSTTSRVPPTTDDTKTRSPRERTDPCQASSPEGYNARADPCDRSGVVDQRSSKTRTTRTFRLAGRLRTPTVSGMDVRRAVTVRLPTVLRPARPLRRAAVRVDDQRRMGLPT